MLEAISILVIILLALITKELLMGLSVFKQRQKINELYRIDKTQSHFAEARNKLMDLAKSGEIDINSLTFQYFYYVNTAMMRRPDEYPQISNTLRSVLLSHSSSKGSYLSSESQYWSSSVKEMIRSTADALGHIVIDYSLILRSTYNFTKRSDPDLTPAKMIMILRHLDEISRKKKQLKSEIQQARQELYSLATA